jgi:hypothetical protein
LLKQLHRQHRHRCISAASRHQSPPDSCASWTSCNRLATMATTATIWRVLNLLIPSSK